MKLKLILIILINYVTFVKAQDLPEFGKVTIEELKETEYINDSEANAVILFKHQDTYFLSSNGSSSLITKVYERIKIYNNEGFKHATEEIYLFKNRYEEETVRKIKAVTYTLENGQVVTTKLDKDQIFKTEDSYNYDKVSFTMPNVKEGSIVEFSYQISSPFIWNIDEFTFQYDIPVKQMLAEIRTPKGFRFKQTPKGILNFFPKTSTNRDNRIGMDVVNNRYHIQNVPALIEENYVDNIDNYRSGVMFELVSVELPGYYKSYAKSWGDVAKTIGNSDDYKNQLDRTGSFDNELESVLEGVTDDEEKLTKILDYVKQHVKWNGRDGKYFQYGLRKALKEKKGNAADVNLMVVAMLRYAGFYAHPVVISTKDNAVPFFPTHDRLNYVIAYAKIGENRYFLDATDEFSEVNILPVKDYNWRGLLINNPDKKWGLVDLNTPDKASEYHIAKIYMNKDGSAEGEVKSRYDKHEALKFRTYMKNRDREEYVANMEQAFFNIEIDSHELQQIDSANGPVKESFNFYKEEFGEQLESKIYFEPLAFFRMYENPFKLEERKYPVDYGYPFKHSYMVHIESPEGFKIESKPDPLVMKLPDSQGTFMYRLKELGNGIQLMVTMEINSSKIYENNYAILKEFYKQIIAKEAEKVVLSKI